MGMELGWKTKLGLQQPPTVSFFKVMIGDFREVLHIPPQVARSLRCLLNQYVFLKDLNGRTWRTKVLLVGCSLQFAHGWDVFVSDHSIDVGELLVFQYISTALFSVQIFGTTACERMRFCQETNEDYYERRRKKTESNNKGLQFHEDFRHFKASEEYQRQIEANQHGMDGTEMNANISRPKLDDQDVRTEKFGHSENSSKKPHTPSTENNSEAPQRTNDTDAIWRKKVDSLKSRPKEMSTMDCSRKHHKVHSTFCELLHNKPVLGKNTALQTHNASAKIMEKDEEPKGVVDNKFLISEHGICHIVPEYLVAEHGVTTAAPINIGISETDGYKGHNQKAKIVEGTSKLSRKNLGAPSISHMQGCARVQKEVPTNSKDPRCKGKSALGAHEYKLEKAPCVGRNPQSMIDKLRSNSNIINMRGNVPDDLQEDRTTLRRRTRQENLEEKFESNDLAQLSSANSVKFKVSLSANARSWLKNEPTLDSEEESEEEDENIKLDDNSDDDGTSDTESEEEE